MEGSGLRKIQKDGKPLCNFFPLRKVIKEDLLYGFYFYFLFFFGIPL